MLWRSAHVAAMLGMSEVFVDADERHRMRLDLSYRISIKISLKFFYAQIFQIKSNTSLFVLFHCIHIYKNFQIFPFIHIQFIDYSILCIGI
uniref:Secreted protein n=1 Tax=Ascaris lumbricoides TaxID=6252 RepID=A0A0M3HJK6_ASCLU